MRSDLETKQLKIVLLLTALLLCVSVLPVLPAYFFMGLRWAVCVASSYTAILLRSEDDTCKNHFISLALLATFFNPIFPIQVSYSLGLMIHLGVAIYFLTLAKKL